MKSADKEKEVTCILTALFRSGYDRNDEDEVLNSLNPHNYTRNDM